MSTPAYMRSSAKISWSRSIQWVIQTLKMQPGTAAAFVLRKWVLMSVFCTIWSKPCYTVLFLSLLHAGTMKHGKMSMSIVAVSFRRSCLLLCFQTGSNSGQTCSNNLCRFSFCSMSWFLTFFRCFFHRSLIGPIPKTKKTPGIPVLWSFHRTEPKKDQPL